MRKLRLSSLRSAALTLVLAPLVACGGGGAEAATPPGDVGADAGAPFTPSIEVVGDADLEAALAARRGEGLLLNFWAIWCEPCVAELPDLVEVAREHEAEGGRVVGLSFDLMVAGSDPTTIETTMADFMTKHGVEIPVLVYDHDDYEAINERYALPGGIPVTLAIDANGDVVDRHEGKAGKERFVEMMRKALGSGS